MRTIRNFIIKFFFILLVVLVLFDAIINNGFSHKIIFPQNPSINTATPLHIETLFHNKHYQPDSIEIDIYNKYNKAEDFTFKNPRTFKKGVYDLIITPRYSGEYIINVSSTYKNEHDYFSSTFTI